MQIMSSTWLSLFAYLVTTKLCSYEKPPTIMEKTHSKISDSDKDLFRILNSRLTSASCIIHLFCFQLADLGGGESILHFCLFFCFFTLFDCVVWRCGFISSSRPTWSRKLVDWIRTNANDCQKLFHLKVKEALCVFYFLFNPSGCGDNAARCTHKKKEKKVSASRQIAWPATLRRRCALESSQGHSERARQLRNRYVHVCWGGGGAARVVAVGGGRRLQRYGKEGRNKLSQ